MAESKDIDLTDIQHTEQSLIPTTGEELKNESWALINQIVKEQNVDKTKDLTALFNLNQTKKTMMRVNKLGELMDVITDQAITRFSARPDQISNKELLDGMRIVSDMIDKSCNQISTQMTDTPLIQINQQTTEVNVTDSSALDRTSRDRVAQAVLNILNEVKKQETAQPIEAEIIEEGTKNNEE